MSLEPVMIINKTGPTTAEVSCPCGNQFTADVIDEFNVILNDRTERMICICPVCGRLEPVNSASPTGGLSPYPNRIRTFLL